MALVLFSCASQYANHGTASDRTGTNGATNGTGKAPTGTASWRDYVGKHYVENIGNTTVTIVLTEIKSLK